MPRTISACSPFQLIQTVQFFKFFYFVLFISINVKPFSYQKYETVNRQNEKILLLFDYKAMPFLNLFFLHEK